MNRDKEELKKWMVEAHGSEIADALFGVASGKCGFTTLSKLQYKKIDSFTTFRNRFF
ncbi:hypothetical protein [Bacillus subtilis]|uniref:hypothetical protein n=1 Tax=Bacillus subtilis TaxID=1423 RepID=UPI0015E77FF0|nr:hypothetical protein [Bacillus subtilis]